MATIPAEVRHELLEATDAEIDAAVRYADPMVLRGLMHQLTGDPEIAATMVAPRFVYMYDVLAPASKEDRALLRSKAAGFLKAYRDSGAAELSIGPADRLPESLELAVGAPLLPGTEDVWLEELALDPTVRSLKWKRTPDPDRLARFSVVVIGTGMGGLNAVLQLKRAGISFTVFEKNSGVGGTWFENRYPGARVDSPSRAYTHVFGVGFDFPYAFCPQQDNGAYFDWVADEFDLRDDIVFNTEVTSLTWDEDTAEWEVTVAGPEGEQSLRANAVITAVGFLNRPNIPEIPGMSDFAGPSWHTARWPQNFDIKGKRIAVVGTGCTGYQMIPELALDAGHVTVFQRTPQWLFELHGVRSKLPPEVSWLERNFPYYANFLRFRMMQAIEGYKAMTSIDPDFEDPFTLSAVNKRTRDVCIDFLERKLEDPELVAKMTPPHPPFSARPVIADADYSVLDALRRDNVTLVTEGIRQITHDGIVANDGEQHDVDVIVYATGFQATEYLFPMTVTGREGTLEEFWSDGGPRAHRFCMVPGFPNLWMIYGPNTNGPVHVPQFEEFVTKYALQCMEHLILDDKRAIEPRSGAYWQFNEAVDNLNSTRNWSDPRAQSYWHRSVHGRSAVMCPYTLGEVWNFLREPEFAELESR